MTYMETYKNNRKINQNTPQINAKECELYICKHCTMTNKACKELFSISNIFQRSESAACQGIEGHGG